MTKYKKIWRILFWTLSIGIIISCIVFFIYFYHFNQIVLERFSGKRWELPARIYARPLELYSGMDMKPESLAEELHLMQYRQMNQPDAPGSFAQSENTFEIFTRSFMFDDEEEPSKKLRILIKNGKIRSVTNLETGIFPDLIQLDPVLIGSFYPTHNEDRILVRLNDVKKDSLLVKTLLAVEDRNFYIHRGVSPLAILRALIANIRNLRTVQGGSTLTQQLVKNFFLTREQSLKRKFDEAFMSLALEWNYDKDEILEAYLNEVYLGQDGERAIHGFGLGSLFYFGRLLSDLRPHEIAMLVGLLKGPSYYDPRQYPDRAVQRRDTILGIMENQQLISTEAVQEYRKAGLGVIDDFLHATTKFPAFLDLIKRQLLQEYSEKDLQSEGLRIFTSFDPQVQSAVERGVASQIKKIESQHGISKDKLEVSAIVTATGGNEILGLIGGRNPRFQGFNRALDAKRPIGSLIKPAVYLTALASPNYTLITPLEDSFLKVEGEDGKAWIPQNYDRQYHEIIPLYMGLVHSYNVSTVRLGLMLGLDKVIDTVNKMGVQKDITLYPSLLLGTIEMSTLEVAQMYQTLASGGFFSPIRAIRSVFTPDGRALQRFPLTVSQNFATGPVYLLNKILQTVVLEGTASSLKYFVPQEIGTAGKTGTTNDLKDSWFAGFTGNRLAVVWIGRDDNKSCGLTGSSGALQVWGKIMGSIPNKPLNLPQPETVEWVVIDRNTGMRTDAGCDNVIAVPFMIGSAPWETVSCQKKTAEVSKDASVKDEKKQKSFFIRLKEFFE